MTRRVYRWILIWSLSVVSVGFLRPVSLPACEIEIKVRGNQKTAYLKGDIVILSVDVFLTHRDCPKGIQATRFKAEGMEILGATKWKEIASGKFRRLIKVRVTSAEHGEGAFHARRTCDKEGGYGVLKLKVPVRETAGIASSGS